MNALQHAYWRRGTRLVWLAMMMAVLGLAAAIQPARADTKPPVDPTPTAVDTAIVSAGPLNNISITPDLNCQVQHTGDATAEFYPPFSFVLGACGSFLATGGTLYGPANVPAGGSASPRTTWTQVSQSLMLGSGTSGDPYRVVTVVRAGATGPTVTETDSYVVGQESYRTDVMIQNGGATALTGILYRAGDCYLAGSDNGFGRVDNATGSVACTQSQAANSRIEQWFPLSPGSSYYETYYNTGWAKIGSQTAFPNTCDCNTFEDNWAGLSWNVNVPAGASVTLSHLTTFSPLGVTPLTTTKTADAASANAGGSDGYTITISNPNAIAVTLNSINDTLPAGFSYGGSTTGVTTNNPTISVQTLTWTGPFTVPANGSVSLHFTVIVSTTPGTYFNNAGGDAGTVAVVPTGPTAPITVTQAADTTPPTCVLTSSVPGPPAQIVVTVQDADGGLATVTYTATNAAVVVDPFVPGTTSPVNITATKIDDTMGATLNVVATDLAGNQVVCDPTLHTDSSGRPTHVTIDGSEGKVSIVNSGLKSLTIEVNGQTFTLRDIANQTNLSIDISAALVGGANDVTVHGRGQNGTSAFLVFSS